MAGHSKWANIQHRKKAQDSKRGKLFSKLIREITVAARKGGAQTENNSQLRLAIDKALAGNMSRDTINKAIQRGAGSGEDEELQEVTYEGYGPSGVAVLVNCLTNNRNRTVAEVRHAFTKAGGNLGTSGSVAYLFHQIGLFIFDNTVDEDNLMEIALDSNAEDVIKQPDDSFLVTVPAKQYDTFKQALAAAELTSISSEITFDASTNVEIDDQIIAEKVLRLVDHLEDLDDVQNVYTNADISDEILGNLSGLSH